MRDGAWLEWEDEESCNAVLEAEGSPCGPGYRGQRKRCDRSLGGKYCKDPDNGKEVREDFLHRTTKCQLAECPGWSLKPFNLKLSTEYCFQFPHQTVFNYQGLGGFTREVRLNSCALAVPVIQVLRITIKLENVILIIFSNQLKMGGG